MQVGTKVHDAAGRHGVVIAADGDGLTIGWFADVEVVTPDDGGSLPLGEGVNVAAADQPAEPTYAFGLTPPPAGAGQ